MIDRRQAKNQKLREAVDVLKCFEKNGRNYWVKAMELSNAEKGYALVYANR